MEASPPRYERKFFLSHLERHEVEHLVRLHPAIFREIFHQRAINNLYFDSVDLRHYRETVDGVSERRKYRIRWYGELTREVAAPVLEIKSKSGFLVRKRSWPLAPFTVNDLEAAVQGSEAVREELRCMRPVLVNRYRRKYFLAAGGDIRLTVDWDLTAAPPGSLGDLAAGLRIDPGVVLELKYPVGLDQEACEIATWFPFRLTRSSKYVQGIALLDQAAWG